MFLTLVLTLHQHWFLIQINHLLKIIDSVGDYFQLRGYGNLTAKGIREKIKLGQAGIGLTDEGLLFVGKDREADVLFQDNLKKLNRMQNMFKILRKQFLTDR